MRYTMTTAALLSAVMLAQGCDDSSSKNTPAPTVTTPSTTTAPAAPGAVDKGGLTATLDKAKETAADVQAKSDAAAKSVRDQAQDYVAQAQDLLAKAQAALSSKKLDEVKGYLDQLDAIKSYLPQEWVSKIDTLRAALATAKAAEGSGLQLPKF